MVTGSISFDPVFLIAGGTVLIGTVSIRTGKRDLEAIDPDPALATVLGLHVINRDVGKRYLIGIVVGLT